VVSAFLIRTYWKLTNPALVGEEAAAPAVGAEVGRRKSDV